MPPCPPNAPSQHPPAHRGAYKTRRCAGAGVMALISATNCLPARSAVLHRTRLRAGLIISQNVQCAPPLPRSQPADASRIRGNRSWPAPHQHLIFPASLLRSADAQASSAPASHERDDAAAARSAAARQGARCKSLNARTPAERRRAEHTFAAAWPASWPMHRNCAPARSGGESSHFGQHDARFRRKKNQHCSWISKHPRNSSDPPLWRQPSQLCGLWMG